MYQMLYRCYTKQVADTCQALAAALIACSRLRGWSHPSAARGGCRVPASLQVGGDGGRVGGGGGQCGSWGPAAVMDVSWAKARPLALQASGAWQAWAHACRCQARGSSTWRAMTVCIGTLGTASEQGGVLYVLIDIWWWCVCVQGGCAASKQPNRSQYLG